MLNMMNYREQEEERLRAKLALESMDEEERQRRILANKQCPLLIRPFSLLSVRYPLHFHPLLCHKLPLITPFMSVLNLMIPISLSPHYHYVTHEILVVLLIYLHNP